MSVADEIRGGSVCVSWRIQVNQLYTTCSSLT